MMRSLCKPAATAFVGRLLPLCLLAVISCDDGPAGPGAVASMQVVAGDYAASGEFGALVLTTVANGQSTDWVALGAELTLGLTDNGAVTGTLFMPGADEDGGDLDASMNGTWTLNGSTVRVQQTADTFVRDMAFNWTDGVLTAERTFNEVRVRVVLVRN